MDDEHSFDTKQSLNFCIENLQQKINAIIIRNLKILKYFERLLFSFFKTFTEIYKCNHVSITHYLQITFQSSAYLNNI